MKKTKKTQPQQEDIELWQRYKETLDENLRNKLIEKYLPLVRKIVYRFLFTKPPEIEIEDLNSYAIFGLIDAIKNFNPSLGLKFEDYAYRRIYGAIIDYLRKEGVISRSLRQTIKSFEKAYMKLEQEVSCVTEEQLAKELGVEVKDLSKFYVALQFSGLISLSEIEQQEDYEGLTKSNSLESKIEKNFLREQIKKVIDELPQRERDVIILYHYEELNHKEIAKILGVTESRISQIYKSALLHLKAKLAKYGITHSSI